MGVKKRNHFKFKSFLIICLVAVGPGSENLSANTVRQDSISAESPAGQSGVVSPSAPLIGRDQIIPAQPPGQTNYFAPDTDNQGYISNEPTYADPNEILRTCKDLPSILALRDKVLGGSAKLNEAVTSALIIYFRNQLRTVNDEIRKGKNPDAIDEATYNQLNVLLNQVEDYVITPLTRKYDELNSQLSMTFDQSERSEIQRQIRRITDQLRSLTSMGGVDKRLVTHLIKDLGQSDLGRRVNEVYTKASLWGNNRPNLKSSSAKRREYDKAVAALERQIPNLEAEFNMRYGYETHSQEVKVYVDRIERQRTQNQMALRSKLQQDYQGCQTNQFTGMPNNQYRCMDFYKNGQMYQSQAQMVDQALSQRENYYKDLYGRFNLWEREGAKYQASFNTDNDYGNGLGDYSGFGQGLNPNNFGMSYGGNPFGAQGPYNGGGMGSPFSPNQGMGRQGMGMGQQGMNMGYGQQGMNMGYGQQGMNMGYGQQGMGMGYGQQGMGFGQQGMMPGNGFSGANPYASGYNPMGAGGAYGRPF